MYSSNRSATMKMESHISELWNEMRRESLAHGGQWLCAYVATWVETSRDDALTEALFASL